MAPLNELLPTVGDESADLKVEVVAPGFSPASAALKGGDTKDPPPSRAALRSNQDSTHRWG